MEITKFDALQTFYVDSAAVNGSSEIFLTSIDLFFKSKPTSSTVEKPGVVVSICDVENDEPHLNKIYVDSLTVVDYDSIYAFSDASVPTTFGFKEPLILKTNRFYGIVVQYNGPGFDLWHNKQGDKILGTNTPSPGINSAKDGKYYPGTINATVLQPLSDVDLKYKVNIAKFTANTLTVELVNKDYEFLTIANVTGTFVGGEYVYKQGANSTGTMVVEIGNTLISGVGTNFSSLHSGDKVVILGEQPETNGTVLTIASVTSNTLLETKTNPLFSNSSANFIVDVIGKVYSYNPVSKTLILYESTANTDNYLTSNNVLVGTYSKATAIIDSVNEFPVDRIVPMIDIVNPSISTYTGTYNFAYSNGVAVVVDGSKERTIKTNALNEVDKYGGLIQSRSMEVLNNFLYDNVARKSAVTKLTFNINSTTDKLFTSPAIDEEEIDFFVQQSEINSSSDEVLNGVVYDSEVGKNGLALSKHISKKIPFANNRFAEDIRVFSEVYRPLNTDVKFYCKVHNSSDPEAFDDKAWTPLECIENNGRFSSSEDKSDYVEYEFALPKYPETANTLPGTFTVSSGNTVILGQGLVVNNYVLPGDVVRIYNPLEADKDYFVAGVSSSNTSSVTLNLSTANASVLGSGFKLDKVKYKNIAFADPQNDNKCTYFNEALSKISTFDTMQFKIVFLAETSHYIPRVNSLAAIGVSA